MPASVREPPSRFTVILCILTDNPAANTNLDGFAGIVKLYTPSLSISSVSLLSFTDSKVTPSGMLLTVNDTVSSSAK